MMRHLFASKFMEHNDKHTSSTLRSSECNIFFAACKLINRVCFSKYYDESLKGKNIGRTQNTNNTHAVQ